MTRVYSVIALLVFGMGETYWAFSASRLVPLGGAESGSHTYNLLFSSSWWSIPAAALCGAFLGALSERRRPVIEDGKVLRHDLAEFLQHWTHALGTFFLLISGVALGFLFVPRLVASVEEIGFALNLHFVGVVIGSFGVAYHVMDIFFSGAVKDLFPSSSDLKDALAHYAAKLGRSEPPTEGKYLASERLAYLVWGVLIGGMAVTGLIKMSAYAWSLPGPLMIGVRAIHDVFALLLMVLILAHVVLGAMVRWSWPHLVSMLTGYMSEENVKRHHAGWYTELTQ